MSAIKTPVPQTLEQWRAEAMRLSGGDFLRLGFVCPSCGNVATPADFRAAGADPEKAAYECIGRTMNPMPKPKKGKCPCDWAAYGLFRALGRGEVVVMPDGSEVDVFAFASAHPESAVTQEKP